MLLTLSFDIWKKITKTVNKIIFCPFAKLIPLTLGEKRVKGLKITKISEKLCSKESVASYNRKAVCRDNKSQNI